MGGPAGGGWLPLSTLRVLVLDAMGVLFVVRSQVREALLTFCTSRGSDVSEQRLRELYLEATSGRMSTGELWEAVGLDSSPGLDEAYVRELPLNPEAFPFMDRAIDAGWRVGSITNHTATWMRLLREMHGLDHYVHWWTVSDEVGARKPDAPIYESFLATADARGEECLFVDDLAQNLEGARRLGFVTVGFAPREAPAPGHAVVENFGELSEMMFGMRGSLSAGPPSPAS